MIALPGAHEAEAALAIMQLAKPGANVALDSAIFQEMPVAARLALKRLIHVATPPIFGILAPIGGQQYPGEM